MALETPTINISYKRGDSRPITFEISSVETGLPLNLTGYSSPVLAVNSESAPADVTNEQFKVTGTISASEGLISFGPTITDTDLDPATYHYDAQVLDGTSKLLTFVQGKFKIVQDIAKD